MLQACSKAKQAVQNAMQQVTRMDERTTAQVQKAAIKVAYKHSIQSQMQTECIYICTRFTML